MRTIFVILFLLVVKSNSLDVFGSIGDLANSVGKLAENFGSTVSNVSQNVGSHISSTFNGAVQNAGSAWSNLTANMGVKWNELANTSKVVAGNLGQDINKAFGENGAVGNLTSHLGSAWSNLTGNMGEKWNELTNTSKNVTGNLGQNINKAFSENGTMGNWTSHLGSVWSSLKDNMGEKWNELTNTSKVVVGNLGQDIKTAFGENGAVGNWTSHLGNTLEQKFSELKALASKVKAKLISEFSNQTVIEKIATVLNDRHNEASNGSNSLWQLPSSQLPKFNADLNALKNATNLPDYCTPVRDRLVGIIESENVILTPYAYKEIVDLVMGDARLMVNETVACYSAMAAAAKKTSKQK